MKGGEKRMKKTIGTILLTSWIPFIIAIAFPTVSDGFYAIAGLMWLVFGTWAGILLLNKPS